MDEAVLTRLSEAFIRGDMADAMRQMRELDRIPEIRELLPRYDAIFREEHYLRYDVPDEWNEILLAYQQYYRDVFYLRIAGKDAEHTLLEKLRKLLHLPDGDESALTQALEQTAGKHGYSFLGGKTGGYYGPYLWKTTVPTTYSVELPDGIDRYTVNLLRDFVSRSWMDYLTFGERGTRGWTQPDGTICCVESAFDLEGEEFRVSLLKHEAQHASDLRRFPGILPAELEYRAKLVELIYAERTDLLTKFRSEADPNRPEDSHAVSSCRIAEEYRTLLSSETAEIRQRAAELFAYNTEEMCRRYPANHR